MSFKIKLSKFRADLFKPKNILLLILGGLISLNPILIIIVYAINKSINSKNRTIVFTSGYDYRDIKPVVVAKFIDFFMYVPITLRQNLKLRKVYWFSQLTKKLILEKLQDPQYQNIIFIGHGKNHNYMATDGAVTVNDLKKLHLPKRTGEYIQHTCGGGKSKFLYKIIYPNGCSGYVFDRPIYMLENYAYALVKMFKLKS